MMYFVWVEVHSCAMYSGGNRISLGWEGEKSKWQRDETGIRQALSPGRRIYCKVWRATGANPYNDIYILDIFI